MPPKYRIGYLHPITGDIVEEFHNGNTAFSNVDERSYHIWNNWDRSLEIQIDERVKDTTGHQFDSWKRRQLYPKNGRF